MVEGGLLAGLGCLESTLTIVGLLYATKVIVYILWDVLAGVRALFWSRLFDKKLVDTYGKWAVVTGSTDGIGKEYARQLAKYGMNVVLISRTQNKLKEVSTEIGKKYGVEVETIPVDFSLGPIVYEEIAKHLQDKEIGVLVNNVGVCLNPPTKFGNVTDQEIWAHVHVNVGSVPAMTKLVLPGMLARNKGAIINIASMSAHSPTPSLGIYSATKAFVDYFSSSLHWEYRDTGLTIQTINPGYVSTNMTKYSAYIHSPSATVPTASEYVSSALSTLGYSQRSSGYWSHAIQTYFMNNVFNKWILLYILGAWHTFLEEDSKKKKKQ
nr:inactive hydroxysteroid dehydrogenase-like protein 1 [Procambarus clarkii]